MKMKDVSAMIILFYTSWPWNSMKWRMSQL